MTGWDRFRRWTKRIGLGLASLLLLIVAAGSIYELLARRDAATRYPPRGQMVDIGGRKIHLDCRGRGSPTVVFEAGLGTGGSLDWALVHTPVARFTRACVYDRAGILWSDPKPGPQHAALVADDLYRTLKAARITGPLVLVGHSIGGPYTRSYVGRHGDKVAGLVMVDPSHPDQVARLGKVVSVDVHPAQASWLLDAASALSWTGAVRLLMPGAAEAGVPSDAAARKSAFASRSITGVASELDGFDQSMDDARAVRDFADRPLVVLTAMAPFKPDQLKALGMDRRDGARFKLEWKALNAEQAALSSRGRQQIVVDAGHYIQIDRPDVVISAVRDVVDAIRAGCGNTVSCVTSRNQPR